MAFGLYGKTPAPMDPEVQKIILKGYERGEVPTTKRPGEILEPEWDKAVADTKGLAKNDGDILIYALYPTTGARFLKWKYGLEPVPDEVKPKTLEQVKLEDEVYTTIKKKKLFTKVKELHRQPGEGAAGQGRGPADLQRLRGRANTTRWRWSAPPGPRCSAPWRPSPRLAACGVLSPRLPPPRPRGRAQARGRGRPAAELAAGEVPLRAPMPGMIISYGVKVGDKVNTGDLVCVLEAMKMQNSLPAPAAGTIKAINFEPGASVAKDAVILVISK